MSKSPRFINGDTSRRATYADHGFTCPKCKSTRSRVTDSRPNDTFHLPAIKRTRECVCEWRYFTYETAEAPKPTRQIEESIRDTMLGRLSKVLLP